MLGKKNLVCSKCFDIVEESLEKYQDFITSQFVTEEQQHFINDSYTQLKHRLINFGYKV